MADVADEVGASRQTVYRMFASRTELLAYIAVERISAMGQRLQPLFAKFTDLEQALVEGSIHSLSQPKTDELFAELIENSSDHSFEQFLFRGSEEIEKVLDSLWGPVLNDARSKGLIRPHLTNQMIIEWIRNVHAMLALRNDYDEAKQRQILASFLVPSIMSYPRTG